jgi:hypothetical protein
VKNLLLGFMLGFGILVRKIKTKILKKSLTFRRYPDAA